MTAPNDRSLGLSADLLDYVVAHSGGVDPIAAELATATAERFGVGAATMNVGQDQARLLEFLVSLIGARTVVEIGTFTGMSALFLARGLPPDGRLVCLELEERYVAVGRPFWERAGVDDRIEVVLGPAAESLAAMPTRTALDLVFIDADKASYGRYLDLALERLSPRGLIVLDNVLWGGAVADPDADDEDTQAIRAVNHRIATDAGLHAVMIAVGDGITLVRQRAQLGSGRT